MFKRWHYWSCTVIKKLSITFAMNHKPSKHVVTLATDSVLLSLFRYQELISL